MASACSFRFEVGQWVLAEAIYCVEGSGTFIFKYCDTTDIAHKSSQYHRVFGTIGLAHCTGCAFFHIDRFIFAPLTNEEAEAYMAMIALST